MDNVRINLLQHAQNDIRTISKIKNAKNVLLIAIIVKTNVNSVILDIF